MIIIEPRHEKTSFRGFRLGLTKTGLYWMTHVETHEETRHPFDLY